LLNIYGEQKYKTQKHGGTNMTKPPEPGIYRHFKGNRYRLLMTARHSETLEDMVVYQALYGERGIWVRPAAMWSERVERDGYSGPRFAPESLGAESTENDGGME